MTRDELVEIMARHMCCRFGGCGADAVNGPEICMSEAWANHAEIALAAIEAAGLVVVPRVPTPDMVIAWAGACIDESALADWAAMIAAWEAK